MYVSNQPIITLNFDLPGDCVSIVEESPVDEVGHGERLEVLARAEDGLQGVGAVVIVADRRPVLGGKVIKI